MILHCYQSFVADAYGNIQPRASVEVRNGITGSLATIYRDAKGAIPINPNTFKADDYGMFRFYAETGRYNIKTTSLGLDTSYLDIEIIGVAQQQIDIVEAGGGDFTTLQDAVDYISRAVPAHDSSQLFQFNIYGNVGGLTTYQCKPFILNCVTDAQVGNLVLNGSYVAVSGSLIAGTIVNTGVFTLNTGSSLDCTSITNKGGRMEFYGTVATDESQTSNNGLHNIICDGGNIYFGGTVSAKSQNRNFLASCNSGKITFNCNIDIQANMFGVFETVGGNIQFNGSFLSSPFVYFSAFHANTGFIYLGLQTPLTVGAVAGSGAITGVSAINGGSVAVNGSAITCNGFTNASYAANGGVIYAAPSKILQGSSSALANITTNAYNTSGSAIFLGVA